MKPSEETRIGKTISAAQERIRQCMCRTGTAAQWHLEKAVKVVKKPKLLERVAPHLEGEAVEVYLAALPGWIEQTTQQDARCAETWADGRAAYPTQRDHLIAILLRYDFSLRSYERFAREPSPLLAGKGSSSHENTHDETATRMTADEYSSLLSKIEADLEILDKARAELVAGHEELVMKLVNKSLEKSPDPIEEVTAYARNGLAKAAENFDARRGHRFSTYAQWWIKTAIKEKKVWEK